MKLLIAIPTMDTVPVDFMKSLLYLTRRLSADRVDYQVAIESGTLIYMARDRLANVAINGDYTHVLWLDSDMVFGESIVDDLRFSGHDFVTGIAHGRRKPFMSCLFKNIELDHLERWKLQDYPIGPFEVAGCGMACVLITTDILRAVKMKDGTCFTPFNQYGEDLSFCKRARALGYRIFAEPAVRLGHVGHLVIWPDDCERYRDEIH